MSEVYNPFGRMRPFGVLVLYGRSFRVFHKTRTIAFALCVISSKAHGGAINVFELHEAILFDWQRAVEQKLLNGACPISLRDVRTVLGRLTHAKNIGKYMPAGVIKVNQDCYRYDASARVNADGVYVSSLKRAS